MKKLKLNHTKLFIRFDKPFERVKRNGWLKLGRKLLKYPPEFFKDPFEFERWQMKNLWLRRCSKKRRNKKIERYENIISYITTKIMGLSLTYKSNVEQYFALGFSGGYHIEQPGIPHIRTDLNYLRNKKIDQLYDSINPKTGKKFTAGEVSLAFQPKAEYLSFKKFDRWTDQYGVGSGNAVRKIVSKYKKSLLI